MSARPLSKAGRPLRFRVARHATPLGFLRSTTGAQTQIDKVTRQQLRPERLVVINWTCLVFGLSPAHNETSSLSSGEQSIVAVMRRLAVVLLVLASVASAQSPTVGSAEQGQRVFAKSCAFCHGADATGGEGPNLILSEVVRHDKDGNLIGDVIHNGRPDKGMPAIPLSAADTADVVAFIHARVKESDRRSAGQPNAGYPLARLDTGNAAAGRVFFERHCSGCHSPAGDLAGIAKKYPPVQLQSRFLYPSGVKQTVTVHARGKTYTGELVYADPFTIAIRDRDGWYHSWPPAAVRADISDPLAGHRELLGIYREADVHNVFAYLETLR